ncbi:MAG: sulfatase-like hydrolase/transferase [Acidobacteriaceae bacterium]
MKPHRILQSAGIAAIILYPLYGANLTAPEAMRMHSPAPVTNYALAMIANLVFLTLLVSLLWLGISRTRLAAWLQVPLPGVLAASLLEAIYLYKGGVSSNKLWVITFLASLALTFLLRGKWPRGYRGVLHGSHAVLMGMGMFSLLVVSQLVRMALWRPAPNFTENMPTVSAHPSGSHPRVVWILMDELSYDQVFEHRASGLALPNFDALRQSSTLFTNVQPASEATQTAVPSILLGRVIDRADFTSNNRYLVAFPGQQLQPFPAAETPFALAQKQGLTTSVIGWYNPYCTMLAPYLNHCYWTREVLTPAAFIVGDGFWRNVSDAWVRYWIALHPMQKQRPLVYSAKTYQDFMQRADTQFAQATPDFIFLHLPLPHPPGFYNRQTGQFDASNQRSYLDNLALADITLGQLLSTLQSSPRWANTSIVLCGDHSWRTSLIWRKGRHWTPEDEAASRGGVFDPRPMLMVHQAGQSTPATASQPFPLVRVHDILDSLVLGQQPNFE